MLEKIKNLYSGVSWADIKVDKKTLAIVFLIAILFGAAARFYITYKQFGNELFMFNGAPIIKSPDGYFFAEGARDILDGAHAPQDGRSPTNRLISQFTAALYYIAPGISFEWFIYSLPAVIAPLVAIPIIMLGIEAGSALIGFFASLVALTAIGFYSRSIAGYYDDDFLVLILPFFAAYGFIRHLRVQDYATLAYTAIAATIYSISYGNANTLMTLIVATYAAYILRYDRKNSSHYILLAASLLAISGLPPLQKIVAVLFSLFIFRKNQNSIKTSLFALIVAFGVFAAYGGLGGLFGRINYYIFKPQVNSDAMHLYFYSTLKTVAESQYSNFHEIYKSFSGNGYLFFAGLAGFVLLTVKDRRFLLLLPLLMTGLMAIDGGTRFTPYGSPILALGLLYISVTVLSLIPTDIIRYPLLSIAVIGFMYPNYKELKGFEPPSAVLNSEANTLSGLSKTIKQNDYMFSWWDYGYQNRYYIKCKTLSDGGAQEGGTVYPESMALVMPSSVFAANILRDAAETREKLLKEHLASKGSVLADIMTYGANPTKDPWVLMSNMAKPEYVGMPKTRDVYWMMPFRMLQIYGVIQKFAATDPVSGKMNTKLFYAVTGDSSPDAKIINFPNNGVSVNKDTATIEYMGQKFPLGAYMKVSRLPDGATIAENKVLYPSSRLIMLYMSSYNTYLVMDSDTFMSNFIQMFVMGKYDNTRFELVNDTQMMKVFKLKK